MRPSLRRTVRRLAATLALLAGWATLAVVAAPPAGAHALLVEADPAEGARLPVAPDHVTLTFSEPVELRAGSVRVVDSRGVSADAGAPAHPDGGDTQVTVPLRAGLGDGSYVVTYVLVSADLHSVTGGYAFVVGDRPLATVSGSLAEGAGTDPAVGAGFALARWMSFAGLALLGGLVFVVALWPAGRTDRGTRARIRLGWRLATAATAASLLLQGPYAAGEGLASLFSPDLLAATMSTRYGRLLALRLLALVVLGLLARRILREPAELPEEVRTRDENVALGTGLVLVATFAGSGHAAAGSASTLAIAATMAHLGAMSVWLGGLAVALRWLDSPGSLAEAATLLPRFSRLAAAAVTVLGVTGLYQAWREVGTATAPWETGYGRLLAAKLAGVLAVLAAAAASRRLVRRRYALPAAREGGSSPARLGRLRTSIALEAGAGVAVLAVTAVLVATAPARTSGVPAREGSAATPPRGTADTTAPARLPTRPGTP